MSKLWLIPILALALAGCIPIDFNETYVPPTNPAPVTQEVMGTSSGDWYEIYFTSPVIPFDDVYTGGIESHLIQKIDAAQISIDLAVFEFSIETVARALIRAENRGVVVRAVYDNEHTADDPQMPELIDAGIPAIPDDRSAFMHNKFFVFDGQCIWTGSFNISMNAAYRNNENAIYFCSTEAAANYTAEFAEMFSGEFGPSSPANTPYPIFTVDGITIENYFAPEDNVMDQIIAEVNSAQTSIHFMAFSFTDNDLGQAMIDRSFNGVSVEGIFETSQANTRYSDPKTDITIWYSECRALLQRGLDVRLDGNPKTFHHKVIVIDGTTVIFGSFNFSANANESNDENLLIVHDPTLAQAFEQEYQRMKAQSITPSGDTCTK